ncbi:hypothetical protein QNE68_001756, partial [Vibrio fluvialis]|nr:hypothetical protein [Vibrio fluvialis]
AALATETLSKGRELKDSEAIKIKKDYKSELLFNILVRQERLEQILKEYAKIKSFEFEYATLTPDVQAATPLASHVLKKRERLRFHTPTNVNSLASDIAAFVKRSNVSSGKIKVEDEFGDEFPLKIFDMPDYFAIYDYDVLAEHMNHIKSSEFYTSHLVTLLAETYNSEEYDHIFGVEVRDEA